MRYKQINIRMPRDQYQDLRSRWLKFKRINASSINFNKFVNTFLQSPNVEPLRDPLQPKVPVGNTFFDARGKITNILNRDITAVAIIESKKGTERSNHWHSRDWHYLFVLSGKMEYFERNLDNTYSKTFVVNQGEMVFTAPGLIHKTVFLEDTVLLSLGNYVDHDSDTQKEVF